MWRGAHLHLEAGIKVEDVALALSLAGNSACRPGFSPRWSQDCTDKAKRRVIGRAEAPAVVCLASKPRNNFETQGEL
jgi:hypothetical protein